MSILDCITWSSDYREETIAKKGLHMTKSCGSVEFITEWKMEGRFKGREIPIVTSCETFL